MTARVQLKVDTGLARNGATPEEWPRLVERAAELEAGGVVHVTGIWSHFVLADAPASVVNGAQLVAFDDALAVVDASPYDRSSATSRTPRPPWRARGRTTTSSAPESRCTASRPAVSSARRRPTA